MDGKIMTKTLDFAVDCIMNDSISPEEVAAALTVTAQRLYRTLFKDPAEFETMMAEIYSSRDRIQPYEFDSQLH